MDHDDCSSSSSNEHLLTPSPSSAASLTGALALSPKRKARRKKCRETRHPVYRGGRERNDGKWLCEVRQPNEKSRIWVGTYPTPEMAARAHDVAAIALRSKPPTLSFKDSAWLLPSAASGQVASEAAEMFTPVASPRESLRSPVSAAAVDEQAVVRAPPAVSVDEEALFNMPGLLREMAEGLMLTPPGMQGGFDWDDGGECSHMDMSLWSN